MKNQNYANIGAALPDVASMDKKILVQQPSTTRTATGAKPVSYSDWRTVWARVDYPNTGNDEGVMGDQDIATRRAKFTVRYTGQIGEKWRIVYEGDTYDIVRIVPLGRKRFEEITAEVRK